MARAKKLYRVFDEYLTIEEISARLGLYDSTVYTMAHRLGATVGEYAEMRIRDGAPRTGRREVKHIVDGEETTVARVAERYGVLAESVRQYMRRRNCSLEDYVHWKEAGGVVVYDNRKRVYPVDGEMLTLEQVAERLGVKKGTVSVERTGLKMDMETFVHYKEARAKGERSNCMKGIRRAHYPVDGRTVTLDDVAAEFGVAAHTIESDRSRLHMTMEQYVHYRREKMDGRHAPRPNRGKQQPVDGEMMNSRQAAIRLGVDPATFHQRMKRRGWTIQQMTDVYRAEAEGRPLPDWAWPRRAKTGTRTAGACNSSPRRRTRGDGTTYHKVMKRNFRPEQGTRPPRAMNHVQTTDAAIKRIMHILNDD